jgi:hypothetical protein
MARMKIKLWICMFLLVMVVSSLSAVQLIDSIHLKNGEIISGLIIEEIPNRQVTIENQQGTTTKVRIDDIARISKRRLPGEGYFEYADVVFLEDGVVFRGTIVERVPGSSITIELENGILLSIPSKDIWKIMVEKEVAGAPRSYESSPVRSARLELQIKLSTSNLEAKKAERGGDTEAASEVLEEEIGELQEAIENLEQEREHAEQTTQRENEQIERINEDYAGLDRDLSALVAEIESRIQACSSPDLKAESEQKFFEIQRLTVELVNRAKEVSLIQAQDPRLKQLEERERASELSAIITSGHWNERRYRGEVAALVHDLSREAREEVYQATRQSNSIQYTTSNLFPLVPAGSWKQGDYLGAAISSGVGIAGAALFMATVDVTYPSGSERARMTLTPLSWVSFGIMAGGYAFSLLEPLWFQSRSNSRLRQTLDLD